MDPANLDAQLCQAGFDHVNRLAALRGGVLDSADLAGGFEFGGERIPLINPQRGIFKPQQMAHLLSIKTVFPRQGGRVWYDDQREAHRQIYAGDDVVEYAFMGTDPNSPDNRWLRDAMQHQIPVIYFLGTSPGRYQPIIPTFIVGWHPERLRVQLAFGALVGASAQALPPDTPERRYALREVKARLHQASFRDAVLAAYRGRCAISHLPEPRLSADGTVISLGSPGTTRARRWDRSLRRSGGRLCSFSTWREVAIGRIEMLVRRFQKRFHAWYAGSCVLGLATRSAFLGLVLSR
jgi:putative restriction endonuclease